MDIQKIIKDAPDCSGVYIMKDKEGNIIYVGKAKSLRDRLKYYLSKELNLKTLTLLSQVHNIEYKLTPNESLALLLERSLIQEYQPRFNIALKDDKSFPWIIISKENFPYIGISRRRKDLEKYYYFGPYPNTKLLKSALKLIRKLFPYRSCKKIASSPCIYYRINLCPGICIGKIDKERYQDNIKNIVFILEGKVEKLIDKLSQEMHLYAKNLDFENAARIRDQIKALASLSETNFRSTVNSELNELKDKIKLSKLPIRIEAFDISNLFGYEACGAMVSFLNGLPDKSNYRRFRIKTVSGIDDYKMLREVILRRYKKLVETGGILPDLIIIDGGKAHLKSAYEELKKIGVDIPIISIAKKGEKVYTLDKEQPLILEKSSSALNLIRRIRDEAHRFAIKYHHILRKKKLLDEEKKRVNKFY